jgi:hypothetical protein
MKKIFLLFSLSIMLLSIAASAQTKTVRKSNTKPLPDCVIIKDGMLQAKAGYTVTVSTDGKTFTVSKANSVAGTFVCSCKDNATGECGASVRPGGVICVGTCSCSITVVVSGIAYTLDLSEGLLRKN